MKPYLIIFLIALVFSCKKDSQSEAEPAANPDSTKQEKYEALLKMTGCKVKEASSVMRVNLKLDSLANTKLLLGSRGTQDRYFFWLSSYDSKGDPLWDITVKSPEKLLVGERSVDVNSFAYNVNVLDDEKIAVFQILTDKKDVVYPIVSNLLLFSKRNGELIANTQLKAVFSAMLNLKKTFLIYNTWQEQASNPHASDSIFQINKSGTIVKTAKPITTMPSEKDIILNDNAYLVKDRQFEIRNLFGEKLWPGGQPVKDPTYLLDEKNLTISYTNLLNVRDTAVFNLELNRISYESHHTPLDNSANSGAIVCEIGKEYVAGDGMAVRVNTFTIRKNGLGTVYYNVSYTLKNNTKDKKISEGLFRLYNEDFTKALPQYGFFGELLPGESLDRSVEFKELESVKMSYLNYHSTLSSFDSKPVLFWNVPQGD